jgi:hypothetical protein
MTPDELLSRDSRFAESPPLLAKVDATYSLLGEVAEMDGDVPPGARTTFPDWPLADDPLVRRSLDLLLEAKTRGSGAAAEALAPLGTAGFAPLPGPKDMFPDARFAPLRSPGECPLHVLVEADDDDAWTVGLRRLFTEVLGNPGKNYDIVAGSRAEAGAVQDAVDLLSATLPQISRSVLSHTSLVVLVDGPDAFESATDRRIPRAVFLSREAFANPVRLAEALLHESVHQKLYDLQLVYQIYRSDYAAAVASTVAPPWHGGRARWSFDRAVAACHVYTHLHAFFAALPPQAGGTSQVDVPGSARQAADRALFLHSALTPLAPTECNASGRAFIGWIGDRLTAITC